MNWCSWLVWDPSSVTLVLKDKWKYRSQTRCNAIARLAKKNITSWLETVKTWHWKWWKSNLACWSHLRRGMISQTCHWQKRNYPVTSRARGATGVHSSHSGKIGKESWSLVFWFASFRKNCWWRFESWPTAVPHCAVCKPSQRQQGLCYHIRSISFVDPVDEKKDKYSQEKKNRKKCHLVKL